jgi:hypothetical protein
VPKYAAPIDAPKYGRATGSGIANRPLTLRVRSMFFTSTESL